MPSFGKKQKEESINDKMVRLFKEGKSVSEISKELEVKADVITNVIRRRCGEDSIPETVIRSKNSMPQHDEEVTLKADMAVAESASEQEEQPAEEAAAEPTEGMTKLERFMLDKEKRKAEAAAEAQAEEEPQAVAEEAEAVSMEGISTDDLTPEFEEPAPEPAQAEETAEMDGISAEEIPEISDSEPIVEHPVDEYNAGEAAAEPEPAPAATTFTVPEGVGGSAFDKMKAFAQSQILANNEKLAQLEAKLSTVEDDYNAQLTDAERAVEESKVTYEEVLTRGDEISEQRNEIKAEHRAALARAEEDYRKKLAELDEEYNNATAKANKVLSEKEDEINKVSDALDVEKESAKNNFLNNQAALGEIKDKIVKEVDSVKAQIESLKEENLGYEKFMN